jgi:hypothetical protein
MDAVNIDKSLCEVQEQNKLLASYTSIYWPRGGEPAAF